MENEQAPIRSDAAERMSSGSAWMTVGTFVSRLLGLLYIIPWVRWMGDPQTAAEANALYDIGYKYYSIFLVISTAGVPSAIAKQMAYYNARKQYGTSQQLFRSGAILMLVMGLASGLVLFLAAPWLAESTPTREVSHAVFTIRSLVPALVLFPLLSIFRGFFQGHQDMKPSAISQITEQFFRVAYMLASVYIIRRVLDGSVVTAVSHSTFAAFIGGAVAILTLALYYLRHRKEYPVSLTKKATYQVKTSGMIKEIIMIAIPFIITGSGIELTQLIDTNTFMPIMERVSNLAQADIIYEYGIFSANINKLVTVLVSLALAIGATSIPVISDTYSRELDQKERSTSQPVLNETGHLVIHNLQLFLMVMLPVALGLFILAGPVYNLVYRPDPLGSMYLRITCFTALGMGAYTVLVSVLQAMDHHKQALIGLALGLVMKLVWQYPLIYFLGAPGAMLATIISFTTIALYYLYHIHRLVGFRYRELLNESIPIVLSALMMFLASGLVYLILAYLLPMPNLLGSILISLLVVAVGVWVYLLLMLKSHKLDLVLGVRAEDMRRKLGLN
ncbi:polysaccharide biosynthesis protein [Aerococcus sanguinicola]|uniref:Polysaccharide biosynthesis protein n=1 Tax=Aerococcus sanguinicola TaxID=119206 RepID=A0A5N1GPB9_9LACT|nr:polysaccharide biosynthesis protein [Aerococcus sanguinicola]KAA9302109.1 polysaccharide biosynthesis protein [Aerococcus sanguinicola]